MPSILPCSTTISARESFGTEVASRLRLEPPGDSHHYSSATLERRFGGTEDMHLLKGHSSVEDLIAALRSFRAKLQGSPVMVDARDFFYSRISMAMGDDIVLEVLDGRGQLALRERHLRQAPGEPREWFRGKNMFYEMPELAPDWREIIATVATTRETYIDRTLRGLMNLPRKGEEWV